MAQFLNVTSREAIVSKWLADANNDVKILDDNKDNNVIWSSNKIRSEIASSQDLWTY